MTIYTKLFTPSYNNVLNLRPNSTSGRLGLSRIHEKNGNFDDAIRLKIEAINLTPEPSSSLLWQLAVSYFSRARAKYLDADYEESIKFLRKALDKNPSFWAAHLTLGNVYKF